ncbi:MAG TPA: hypothetical protein VHS96_16825, partial [Bacteroidia bacterium]|nr:hypothetical protein [Bacteroidia bacterium]
FDAKITAVAMKKYLYIVLGLLGAGLVGYSVTQGWVGLDLPIAGITIKEPGYKFIQGIIAGIGGLLALVLLFVKPKFAVVPALAAVGAALWIHFAPPIIEDQAYEPQKAIFFAVAGGVLLALAGLVAPKKK